jgi:hypothetical protein
LSDFLSTHHSSFEIIAAEDARTDAHQVK